MSRRSETPGLIRRQGGRALYWSARSLTTDPKGFPDLLIRLPDDATGAELRDMCQGYTKTLDLWLDGDSKPAWAYDGTIAGLCDVFERHPESPMQEVKKNTADSYRDSFRVIRRTVGARATRAVKAIEIRGWYRRWRRPKSGGIERPKRAHDAIAALRMALRFGAALEFPKCVELSEAMAMMKFARPGRRDGQMTIAHVRAFIAVALARKDSRSLYMAIGVAAQFETALRQKDIIGEWSEKAPGGEWSGRFTWENIPGGILRLKTSKTKAQATFDLTRYDLLWPLMQRVPQAERVGAIVKGDLGFPIRERSYRKWYREIATAAGIASDVWNMDSRAGAVTEALEAGAELDTVRRAATHSDAAMTLRYDRETEAAIATVAEARKRRRTNSEQ